MSQNYKFKTLSVVQQDKQDCQRNDSNELTVYETGETRTIDFIQKDGTRQCFAYSHLLTAWYGKENDDRVIKIFFATHTITIYGYCLEEVYESLCSQKLKSVKANDERYWDLIKEGNSFVTYINISWKKE